MARRQTAGHSIRISEQTFARLVIAAGEDRIDKGAMAEAAIVNALDSREARQQEADFIRANREADRRGEPTITRHEFFRGPKR